MFKKIIPLLVIFSSDIFFVLSMFSGYQYEGIESSPVFALFSMGIFLSGLSLFGQSLLLKKEKLDKSQVLVMLLPLIIFILYLLSMLFHSNPISTRYFLFFILWILPSIYMGIYVSKERIRLTYFYKYIDIYMLIISIGIVLYIYNILILGGDFREFGGATYQTASYIAAFAFGINIYFLQNNNLEYRFQFTKCKSYKIICLFLLIVQLIGVLTSGGRGGIILICIYSVYFFINFLSSYHRLDLLLKNILIYFLVIFLVILAVQTLLTIPSFNGTFNRVFSYITPSGIDFNATSGRNIVYTRAFNLIKNSPIFGYGYYGIWNVYTNPHNIFLEVLLQGGIIYGILFIYFVFKMLNKYMKIIKDNKTNSIMGIVLLYPLTMLLFSGTYTINSVLWFVASYIFSYNLKESSRKLDN